MMCTVQENPIKVLDSSFEHACHVWHRVFMVHDDLTLFRIFFEKFFKMKLHFQNNTVRKRYYSAYYIFIHYCSLVN